MTIFTPTEEQKSILTAADRLVVVRACPGSGKTTVFAEKVRQLSEAWAYPRKGIAALSFTNAASQEIFNRVGAALVPPHFIGTLDSFILRYVVLPFGHLLGLPRQGAKLVPSPLDARLKFSPFKYGSTAKETVPICSVRIVGGNVAVPVMEFYDPIKKKRTLVADNLVDKAIAMKKKNWTSNGIITHSDSHYIAAALLADHEQRSLFATTIAKRFPVILVDEFQDTMSFLSRALLPLLESASIASMVVGDPDQSIYEFGGAPTDLFVQVEALHGAKRYPMTITQRFGANISAVVSALSHSETTISSAPDKPAGKAILVVHGKNDKDLTPGIAQELIKQLALPGEIVVLGRNSRVCKRLNSLTNMDAFPGGSQLAKLIDSAVFYLRRGENSKASNIIARELWSLLTDHEALPTKHELRERGIDRREWRRYLFKILLEAERRVANETWNEWLVRVKECFEKTLSDLGVEKKLGSSFRSDNKGAVARLPAPDEQTQSGQKYTVLTVHQAKGAQFDNVLIFLGKPHGTYSPCISTQWWGDQSIEEKRIGFVGLSRAKETVILCIHKETHKALEKSQKQFIELFGQVITL